MPTKAIGRGLFRPFHRALEHAELVAQSEHLDLEGCSAAERSPNEREERFEHDGGRGSMENGQALHHEPGSHLPL